MKITSSVFAMTGSVGALASGCPTGTRVNVSLTVGIQDKKKLKDKRKFSKNRAFVFPCFLELSRKAITTNTTMNRAKICPALKPPCLDMPNAVNEVTTVV
ncbi:hypothetical protein ACFS5N_17120 [Mucilaginibacter ximonensis]|uniref:Secreted protein n=1 Tax=Mucilaginibacter ximonensis TaxID=538021 RepID=A0ABW5YG13_9SPHI